MFNTSSTWTGDYVAAGVTRITAQMSNTGPASVPMGIALGTLNVSSGNWWATASPVSIPNDGAWHSVEFGLDAASLTQVQGSDSLNTVLSGAGVLRFVANATPSHVGPISLSGTTIGVDNIRAAGPAAPEVTLSINNTNIPENAGTATITATLSTTSGQPVTVHLGYTGTATNETDYTPSSSQIESVVLQFDRPVTVNSVSSLRIFNHTTGAPVDISSGTLQNNGTAVVTWNLADVSFSDGFYTAELLRTEAVSSQGKPLTVTHSILFHRLPGDGNGSAQVDASDFDDLIATFNTVGGPILGAGRP